jgi:aminopeptidase
MRDPRLTALADLLVRFSTRVRPGDLVAVTAEPAAMPGVEAVFEAVYKAGGLPFYWPRAESLQESALAHATDELLSAPNPVQLDMVEKIDVSIAFWAEQNTKVFSAYDPARVALLQQSRKPFMKRFMQREAEGKLRWVGTQFPTLASAQDAEMSLRQYEDFVFKAGLLNVRDPFSAWNAIRERQQRLCDYLQGKKSVRFHVPPHDGHDGTDLTVDVSTSKWINCFGESNFPDGEVYAGPRSAEGHVNYSFPAVYMGREVQGIRLVFKGGRVVDATAKRGEDFLIKMLDQDAGARTMGEIAIGTNYSITDYSRNTLFDEKIGGTFHAAVGAGYPESGSSNESGLHWDMVCELRQRHGAPGGVIEADGEVFSRNGRFLNGSFPSPDGSVP